MYYTLATTTVPCECPACFCPYSQDKFPLGPRTGKNTKYSFVCVNEHLKCIYLVIGKNASTTIRSAFFGGNESSLIDPTFPLEEYFKFTFVRNPWCRMVSNWKMFTSVSARIKQIHTMTNKDVSAFEDFVPFALTTPNHHWLPQVRFIPMNVDFIGRVEQIETDLDFIAHKLHTPINVRQKRNASKNQSSYKKYYTSELIDLVATHYHEDINRFNYTFE